MSGESVVGTHYLPRSASITCSMVRGRLFSSVIAYKATYMLCKTHYLNISLSLIITYKTYEKQLVIVLQINPHMHYPTGRGNGKEGGASERDGAVRVVT